MAMGHYFVWYLCVEFVTCGAVQAPECVDLRYTPRVFNCTLSAVPDD